MGLEENLNLVGEWYEAISARNLDRILGMYAESIVSHDPGLQEPVKGIEAHKAWETAIFEAFGKGRVNLLNVFGQGDQVVAESVYEMTHTGPLLRPDGTEIPPTNKTAKGRVLEVFTFEGGKITEVHAYYDQLGLMAQLGLGP